MAVWEDYKLANQFKPAGLGGLSSSCIESCLGVHQLLGAPAGWLLVHKSHGHLCTFSPRLAALRCTREECEMFMRCRKVNLRQKWLNSPL